MGDEDVTSRTVLRLAGLTKMYPGQLALDNVSLDLRKGEIHALVGENGAGKSTLIKILAGAIKPDAGTIEIDGKVVYFHEPSAPRKLGFAFVHQERQVAINQTVAENVLLGGLPTTGIFIRRRSAVAQARKVLELFGVDVDPSRLMSDYGSAMHRVIEISRAVAQEAKFLVLDEPTAALPRAERATLLQLIREFANSGGTVLYVSHHLDEILEISDHVTALRNGQLSGSWPRSEVDKEALIQMILGGQLTANRKPAEPDSTEPLLVLSDLASTQDGPHVSLSLRRGEILGLFGRIDAGHELTARAVAGVIRVAEGQMTLNGEPYSPRTPNAARTEGVGFLPGERKTQAVFANASVAENITAGSMVGVRRFGFIDRKKRNTVASEWRDKLTIKVPRVDAQINSLSGGNQQKCMMARLLATDPEILVLEHPTMGVDVGARSEIYTIVLDAAAKGLAALVVSDDIDELAAIAHRVAVFRDGEITGILSGNEISNNNILDLAL